MVRIQKSVFYAVYVCRHHFTLSVITSPIDDVNPYRDTPPSTDHSTGETEDVTPSVSQSVGPATQSGVDSADSQSYTDPSEDTLIPAVQAQPILLEDPLVLNSPRVSIPKKNDAVFKRNKWPQRKFPSVSINSFKVLSLNVCL